MLIDITGILSAIEGLGDRLSGLSKVEKPLMEKEKGGLSFSFSGCQADF